jgi:hypothetical protein
MFGDVIPRTRYSTPFCSSSFFDSAAVHYGPTGYSLIENLVQNRTDVYLSTGLPGDEHSNDLRLLSRHLYAPRRSPGSPPNRTDKINMLDQCLANLARYTALHQDEINKLTA